MNMNKSLIALAIAGAFVSSAAMAEVSFYGQANVSYDVINNDANRNSQGMASNGSRFGFKGSEDLGGGLHAIYQVESHIAIGAGPAYLGSGSTPGLNGTDNFAATGLAVRDTFVGLKSDSAGTVRLGRFDTPYKSATRGMDLFINTIADNRSLMGIGHDVRVSNSVGFNSLNYSGFSVAASYFGDQGGVAPGSLTGLSSASPYVSPLNTNEGFSVAGTYNAGPFYATAAYQSMSNMLATPATTFNDYSTRAWKVGGGYAVDAFALNGVFERINSNNSAISTGNSTAWYLSGKYNVTTADALKLAYTSVNHDVMSSVSTGAKQYSVGYDHKMSNRTTVYALYTRLNNDTNANYALGWNSGSTSLSANTSWAADVNPYGQNVSAVSVGMKHAF